MLFRSGARIVLDTNILKSNAQIKIHPSSYAQFPALLLKGSRGEIVEADGRTLFVRFMLRAPRAGEQEFLKDNVVYFSVPYSMGGYFRPDQGATAR
jgi:hypothetical protein